MGEWVKKNLIATLMFCFVVSSFVGSSIFSYSTLNSKVAAVELELNKRSKNIENQILIDKRLSALENKVLLKFEVIDDINKNIEILSRQSHDFKSQNVVMNNAVVALNNTLDKMNQTLDKLNETVIIVSQDVSHLKNEVDDIKKEVRNSK